MGLKRDCQLMLGIKALSIVITRATVREDVFNVNKSVNGNYLEIVSTSMSARVEDGA